MFMYGLSVAVPAVRCACCIYSETAAVCVFSSSSRPLENLTTFNAVCAFNTVNQSRMAEEKKTKQVNPLAEAKNWEQRLITEQEAPHKWAEAWGELFDNGIPHEYEPRIKHLEEELKKIPAAKPLPKYGQGKGFKEISGGDHKRKKMFQEVIDLSDEQ